MPFSTLGCSLPPEKDWQVSVPIFSSCVWFCGNNGPVTLKCLSQQGCPEKILSSQSLGDLTGASRPVLVRDHFPLLRTWHLDCGSMRPRAKQGASFYSFCSFTLEGRRVKSSSLGSESGASQTCTLCCPDIRTCKMKMLLLVLPSQ